ncbi:unnamed protein product, partial [Ectocarpus sp. 4 AP-2014]
GPYDLDVRGSCIIVPRRQDSCRWPACPDEAHHPSRFLQEGRRFFSASSWSHSNPTQATLFFWLVLRGNNQWLTYNYRKLHNKITHPGDKIFKSRLLRNKDDSKTEQHVFGQLSTRSFQRQT